MEYAIVCDSRRSCPPAMTAYTAGHVVSARPAPTCDSCCVHFVMRSRSPKLTAQGRTFALASHFVSSADTVASNTCVLQLHTNTLVHTGIFASQRVSAASHARLKPRLNSASSAAARLSRVPNAYQISVVSKHGVRCELTLYCSICVSYGPIDTRTRAPEHVK